MTEYSGSTEEKLTSEFNEAQFQIFRLHNIWLEAKQAREKGLLLDYCWDLDSAEIELSSDINRLDKDIQEDKNKYQTKLNSINENLGKAKEEKKIVGFYQKLKEKEMLLRNIQEAAGKGGKFKPMEDYNM